MTDEILKAMERQKARFFDEAAAKAAAVDRDMAEYHRQRAVLDAQKAELAAQEAALAAKYLNQPTATPPKSEAPPKQTSGETLGDLVRLYRTHPESPIHKVRHATRTSYDTLLRRVETDRGDELLSSMTEETLRRWHNEWIGADKRFAMAFSLMAMLRGIVTFGGTTLKRQDCLTPRLVLHDLLNVLRLAVPKALGAALTAAQADLIREKAHEMGRPSIALAQAFQFDCLLRQKDVIGEWVPLAEREAPSDVIFGDRKWVRGIRWEEIGSDLVLRHALSNKQKVIEIDLKQHPRVLAELRRTTRRASGPVIICDTTERPWTADEYRRQWRGIADKCGIPKSVKNMDSRAGREETPDKFWPMSVTRPTV